MKTPHGEECIVLAIDSEFGNKIYAQARGSWQRNVAINLCKQGYVIGYLADGKLRGNAKKYQGHYQESLSHLMLRIANALDGSKYSLISGSVGPNGAFGYYLSD
jgi:hypothetical protein